jgi:hypothetical protein
MAEGHDNQSADRLLMRRGLGGMTMRLTLKVLACVSTGVMGVALAADPPAAATAETQSPATSAAAGAPTPTADAPVTQAPPREASTPPPQSARVQSDAQVEKNLRAQGYKLTMRNGERVFCRRETPIGSHLPSHLNCLTAEEALILTRDAQNNTMHQQRNSSACMVDKATGACGGK